MKGAIKYERMVLTFEMRETMVLTFEMTAMPRNLSNSETVDCLASPILHILKAFFFLLDYPTGAKFQSSVPIFDTLIK